MSPSPASLRSVHLLVFSLLLAPQVAVSTKPTFELGSCGLFEESAGLMAVGPFAAKVALEEGLFDRKLKTTNFSVNFRPANTACHSTGASQKVLPMLLGQGSTAGRIYSDVELDPVIAIVGCLCSSVSSVVAQISAPLLVPMVSPTSTSPLLSDKDAYPYFTRVVPSDSKQGAGLATLVRDLGLRSEEGWDRVTVIYSRSIYGEGIADAFEESDAVEGFTVTKESIPFLSDVMSNTDEDWTRMVKTMRAFVDVEIFPRVIVFPAIFSNDLTSILAMYEVGLATNESVIFSSEGILQGMLAELARLAERQAAYFAGDEDVTEVEAYFFSSTITGQYDWAEVADFFHGWIGLIPNPKGDFLDSPEFFDFWTGLSSEKLAAAGYPDDYPMDETWFSDTSQLQASGANVFWFDAAVGLMVAISNLLAGGLPPAEIANEALLKAILNVSYVGLTGNVTLDENGDRLGSYRICNIRNGSTYDIGEYDAVSGVANWVSAPVFPSGSTEVPRDRPAPCPAGSAPYSTSCEACEAGYFSPSEDSGCLACPSGTYSSESGSSACHSAPAGSYVANEGSTEPIVCPNGTMSSDIAAASCQDCLKGFHSSEAGATSCTWCERGTYSTVTAALRCESCPKGQTTAEIGSTKSSDCICAEGSYLSSSSEACLSCPPAMTCPQGSDLSQLGTDGGTFPVAWAGYMSLASDPLVSYKCLVASQCPGGAPGSCAEHRDPTSVACGDCQSSAYTDGNDCRACSGGTDYLLFVVIGGAIVAVVIVGTALIRKDSLSQTNASLTCAVSMGLFLTGMQSLGIFDQLSVTWIDPIKAFLNSARLFSFNLDILKTDCIFGSDPIVRFGLRLLVLPGLMPVIGAATAMRNGRLGLLPQLVNNIGGFCSICFISILVTCAIPFVCYTHPSGDMWSMRSMPSILCFQGPEFVAMAVLGVSAFLVLPGPFMAIAAYGTWRYPTLIKRHDSHLQLQALRFLYIKFRPECYFYTPIMLTRSLLVSLVPVVVADPAKQILSLCLLLSFFTLAQVRMWPWRGSMINTVDAFIAVLLQTLLMSGAMITNVGQNDGAIAAVNVAVLSAFGFVLLAVILWISQILLIGRRQTYSYFVCHHKASAAAQARLLKMHLTSHSQRVFIDSDDLDDLDHLFEIVKTKVVTLVVYLTQDTLRRPWCAGEITTAFKASKAKVLPILTPSFSPPSSRELEDLQHYVDETGCSLKHYGIFWEAVRESFERLLDPERTPSLRLGHAPRLLAHYKFLAAAVGKGQSGDFFDVESEKLAELVPLKGQVVVSADQLSDETVAAAGILVLKMQERFFLQNAAQISILSLIEKDLQDLHVLAQCVHSARAIIVMLSEGSLKSFSQLCVILETAQYRKLRSSSMVRKSTLQEQMPKRALLKESQGIVPLMLPGFRFPTDEFYFYTLPTMVATRLQGARKRIRSFFRLIVSPFSTHSSDTALDLEVGKVLERIPSTKATTLQLSSSKSFSMVHDLSSKQEELERVAHSMSQGCQKMSLIEPAVADVVTFSMEVLQCSGSSHRDHNRVTSDFSDSDSDLTSEGTVLDDEVRSQYSV